MLMAGWTAYIVDVKGAFLHGDFEDGENIYMEVPKGFRKYYATNLVLLLLQTLYGLKQAVAAFWKKVLRAMKRMNFRKLTLLFSGGFRKLTFHSCAGSMARYCITSASSTWSLDNSFGMLSVVQTVNVFMLYGF